ncbi:hypothetical protein D3C72_2304490 [compost metagenome]
MIVDIDLVTGDFNVPGAAIGGSVGRGVVPGEGPVVIRTRTVTAVEDADPVDAVLGEVDDVGLAVAVGTAQALGIRVHQRRTPGRQVG